MEAVPLVPTNCAGPAALPQGGFERRDDLLFQKFPQNRAAAAQRVQPRRIARPQLLQQPDGAERVTAAKPGNGVFTDDEFRAAAAHIEDQHGQPRQFRIAGHAAKDPFGLLLPGEYLDGQSRFPADGGGQFGGIEGVARRAGADDADGRGAQFRRPGGIAGGGGGGGGDGGGEQLAGGVETGAQAGLGAGFQNRRDPRAGHVGDEQFDGIGADVNDGAALRRVLFICHLDWRRARTAAPTMPASSPFLLAMMSTPFMAPLMP